MIKRILKGKTLGVGEEFVKIVTSNLDSNPDDYILLLKDNFDKNQIDKNFSFIAKSNRQDSFVDIKHNGIVYDVKDMELLNEEDIVLVKPNGTIDILFNTKSQHNSLFVTNQCNSNCIMCSQPPSKDEDLDYFYNLNQRLIKLLPKRMDVIGITGGEPTLLGNKLYRLIESINFHLPNTMIHILTNGRKFGWKEYIYPLIEIKTSNITWGIPLHSDYYEDHDFISQSKNSFYQTVLGIHNLARIDQKIEIRIVVHKQNFHRLPKIAKYIYNTFPFVTHVAFMGLEYIGHAPKNSNTVWIDPYEYGGHLEKAALYLKENLLNVSIYNSPLCITPKSIHDLCVQSITEYKNIFLDQCEQCSQKVICSGLFHSSKKLHSKYIKPILN